MGDFAMSVIRQCSAQADWPEIVAWWFSVPRKAAQLAFTAGPSRQVAYSLEYLEACRPDGISPTVETT